MVEPTLYLMLAATGLAGLGMITFAALAGWRGWLALKQQEIARHGEHQQASLPNASARIEIADLKERLRKLEAIAAGVDL